MPVQVSYPGVYIEELPSGQHTITGVSTSTTAFLGRAPIGSVDEPKTILNFGDYEREFGGLSYNYPMSYAVQDFFLNGGSEAIIVRLFEPEPGEGDGVSKLVFPPSPPPLPEGWTVQETTGAGGTTLDLNSPIGSEGEPIEGEVFTVGSGKTQYVVTSYTPATTGSTPAPPTVEFLPALAENAVTCEPLTFQYGPAPSGWTGTGTGLGIEGGTGFPQVGDVLTIKGNNTPYTVASFTVGATASQGTLTVVETPAPTLAKGAVLTFSSPKPPPLPTGWKAGEYTSAAGVGTLSMTNGAGNPLPGDTFLLYNNNTVYTVVTFTAAQPAVAGKPAVKAQPAVAAQPAAGGKPAVKAQPAIAAQPAVAAQPAQPEKITFTAPATGTLPAARSIPICSDVTFQLRTAAPTGWKVKSGGAVGGTSMVVEPDGTSTGVIEVGQSFQVGTDPTVYVVRHVVRTAGVPGTVYFLPEAGTAFGTNAITFFPPLTLMAANPGKWGNAFEATVNNNGVERAASRFAQYGLEPEDLFNLSLTYTRLDGTTVSENYINVTAKVGVGAPNRLDLVLKNQSNLARVAALSDISPPSGAVAVGAEGNDGTFLTPLNYIGNENQKTGMYMLDKVESFNLMCIPPDQRGGDTDSAVYADAAVYCNERRAFLIVDPPNKWYNDAKQGNYTSIQPTDIGINGDTERFAAVYFPRVIKEDLELNGHLEVFPACGIIAGVMASTDVTRGVWKAPAGQDAGLVGVSKLQVNLTNAQNGLLNPLGINALRSFPVIGPVVWGARTLRGADQLEDDYKYVNVRRLTNYIELSLQQGTRWAVFEPNDESLWSSLRQSVDGFMAGLAQQGAFYSYKVVCDATTTTSADIEKGIVNILVLFAPVLPAEFVVIKIQQQALALS